MAETREGNVYNNNNNNTTEKKNRSVSPPPRLTTEQSQRERETKTTNEGKQALHRRCVSITTPMGQTHYHDTHKHITQHIYK